MKNEGTCIDNKVGNGIWQERRLQLGCLWDEREDQSVRRQYGNYVGVSLVLLLEERRGMPGLRKASGLAVLCLYEPPFSLGYFPYFLCVSFAKIWKER